MDTNTMELIGLDAIDFDADLNEVQESISTEIDRVMNLPSAEFNKYIESDVSIFKLI